MTQTFPGVDTSPRRSLPSTGRQSLRHVSGAVDLGLDTSSTGLAFLLLILNSEKIIDEMRGALRICKGDFIKKQIHSDHRNMNVH